MREVVMHTAVSDSTRETTERLVNILNSTYAKSYLKHLSDNATQMTAEERTQLIRLLEDFEELFGGNLVEWEIEPVNLGLNPGSKPFNSKYYPVLIINKETFRKYPKRLVEIVVLTQVQKSKYSTPLFIIPKKEGTGSFITDYLRLN